MSDQFVANATSDRWRLPLDSRYEAEMADAKPAWSAGDDQLAVLEAKPAWSAGDDQLAVLEAKPAWSAGDDQLAVLEAEFEAEFVEEEPTPIEAAVEAAVEAPTVEEEATVALAVADEDRPAAFETPDVAARYAVAQLDELNTRVADLAQASTTRTEKALERVVRLADANTARAEKTLERVTELTAETTARTEKALARVTELTNQTTARTEAALERAANELHQLASMHEVDLTDQAAGMFGAVQAGADALGAFSKTVGQVTDDLRAILADALKSIGGTDGLAAWVAASAADLAETREELATSLGRIERDLSLLRRRSQADAKTKTVRLDDEQVAYIIDAVTEAFQATVQATVVPDRSS